MGCRFVQLDHSAVPSTGRWNQNLSRGSRSAGRGPCRRRNLGRSTVGPARRRRRRRHRSDGSGEPFQCTVQRLHDRRGQRDHPGRCQPEWRPPRSGHSGGVLRSRDFDWRRMRASLGPRLGLRHFSQPRGGRADRHLYADRQQLLGDNADWDRPERHGAHGQHLCGGLGERSWNRTRRDGHMVSGGHRHGGTSPADFRSTGRPGSRYIHPVLRRYGVGPSGLGDQSRIRRGGLVAEHREPS